MKIVRVTSVPYSLIILLKGQLRFMSQNNFEVVAVSSEGKDISHFIEEEGARYISVPMTRVISPISDVISIVRMYKVLKREKPQIVHSHTPKAGMVTMFAAYLVGVPIRLHTVAGLPLIEANGIRRKILETIERLVYACSTQVYPNSKKLAEFIAKNKLCHNKKMKVLGNGSSNGIDSEFFNLSNVRDEDFHRLEDKFHLGKDKFVFVYIGRLVIDKGVRELISAFSRLENKYPFIRLLLVGAADSGLNELPQTTTDTIDSNEKILKAGFQKDIRPFLAISDALVFPTYREGFPNVPMQAGCFHLPCIVTDINGCNEIVVNEVNGLIIPPKDESALHDAMERILSDSKLYGFMKASARRMIVERYDQKFFWSLLLNEYQNQLKNEGVIS